MQKTDFKIVQSEQQIRDTEELKKRLKNDETVLRMLKLQQIPERCLEVSPWKIEDWRIRYQPCVGCTSLTACRQEKKGYYSALTYDGMLQNVIMPCAYMRQQLSKEKHLENYLVSDLPKALKTVSFKRILADNESKEYLSVLNEAIEASHHSQGLYIHGTLGSGKTYLCACACNDHASKGEKVAFIHYPSFTQRMASLVRSDEYRDELKRLMYADFLVIDDIGAENCTEWNRDVILMPLLNHRYEEGLATWFSSNCDIPSLQRHFTFSANNREDVLKAERIIERIRHMAKAVALTGRDRRQPLSQ
ncbi:MAG: hypothetical protein E7185_09145 [Erysipelotrichaceae bacterium]|jgi:primosomal protein DnaI|nr:hypothetical protein [Erysipelotrichaceae bacterium]